MNNLRTQDFRIFDNLADSFAADSLAGFFNQLQTVKLVHNGRNAAGFVQINDVVAATRAHLSEVRSFLRDFIEQLQRQVDACFVSDSRQMQRGVGAAADCHINSNSVLEGIERHNVARQNVFLQQTHNSHACVLSQSNTLAVVSSGDSAVAGQAHAQNLSQAVHGICSEQTGAAAAAGACTMLDFSELCFINLTGLKTAGSFKYSRYADISALITTGQHRTAADNNGRDVQTGCCHQHTRNNFITVRNQD